MYTPVVVVSRSAFDRAGFYLCIGYVYITADEEYLSSTSITTLRLLNSHTLRWHQRARSRRTYILDCLYNTHRVSRPTFRHREIEEA